MFDSDSGFCRPAAAALAAALVLAPAAFAQDYGDTPYVPTPQHVVDKMLEVAGVGPKDYVIDLGSGDGRMVITAAKKFGARGFGVDLDRSLVRRSNNLAARAGVAERAVFYERDLYQTDLSRATVLTMYLLPEVNLMVRAKLLKQLKPGTRIVSHDYGMGEWKPDEYLVLDAPDKPVGADFKSKVFYWVVPAVVSGKWRWQLARDAWAEDFELKLDQMFQEINGSLSFSGRTTKIGGGRLSGETIRFFADIGSGADVVRYQFTGRVAKQAIEGEAQIGTGAAARRLPWKAMQTEASEPAHAALKPPAAPKYSW
ncbi:MAG: class I SAM-dependent methyltransferase [Betaproteobacteria bacterium]|nr:class I SAM-dependent methyltransferase [Betaproteobacteria bacterium]